MFFLCKGQHSYQNDMGSAKWEQVPFVIAMEMGEASRTCQSETSACLKHCWSIRNKASARQTHLSLSLAISRWCLAKYRQFCPVPGATPGISS